MLVTRSTLTPARSAHQSMGGSDVPEQGHGRQNALWSRRRRRRQGLVFGTTPATRLGCNCND